MTDSSLYRGVAIALLLVCAAGCGKKGDLYRPGDAPAKEQSADEAGKPPTGELPPPTPGSQP